VLNGNSNGKAIESARPVGIPGLDRIADDPRCLLGLSKSAAAPLMLRLAAALTAVAAWAANEDSSEQPSALAPAADRMLTVRETAELLRHKPRWIYDNADHLPFVHRVSSKSFLCSENGIRRWLQRHNTGRIY
jgi:hypothetical protein